MQTSSHVQIGQQSMIEAINSGADLPELMRSLVVNRQALPDMLGAAIGVLIECYSSARNAGAVVDMQGTNSRALANRQTSRIYVDVTQSLNGTDVACMGEQLSFLATAVHRMRESGITWSLPITPEVPAGLAVLSMPSRMTSIRFERDPKSMEIIGSTQIERDMVL